MVTNCLTDEDFLLYTNNVGRKSYQWELWECCDNLCDFCYIGKNNRHTDKQRQLKSLRNLKDNLKNLDFDVFNNVSLIGGEFFQGQLEDREVRNEFFEVIEMLADLYVKKKIGSIWLSATLTKWEREGLPDLEKTLQIFEDAGALPIPEYGASGLWICTSWDAQGRFHTKKSAENWTQNMKELSSRHPWVKKNTTIILTQKLCEMYTEGEFEPRKFMKEFDTTLFYKSPGITQQSYFGVDGLPNLLTCDKIGKVKEYLTAIKKHLNSQFGFQFFPDRETFRKFLIKYAKEDPDTYDRLFNVDFRADELNRNNNDDADPCEHIRFKGSNLESNIDWDCILNEECLLEPASKKHIITYAMYSDSNACMICDRDQIWKSIQQKM